jgi:hypothetical protein
MWPVYRKGIAVHFDDHLTRAENDALRSVLRRVLESARATVPER